MTNELNMKLIDLITIESQLIECKNKIKELEERKADINVSLIEHFETVSDKPIETDEIKVSYVKPSVRYSIDKAKLEEKYPAIAEEFTKETKVRASVRISLKKGE